jgi:hypothetical protein
MSENTPTHDDQEVYVIEHELGLYKIGISMNPEKRLRELQVGNPFTLTLRQTANPVNARRVEKHLHDTLSRYHFRGEWFDLPDDLLDLTIPTHVSPAGVPNKDVGVETDRDIDTEWIRTFRKAVTAFKDGPKHQSEALSHLQREWRDYLEPGEEDEGMPDTPTIHEAMGETAPGELMCARCGYTYDHTENECPVCDYEGYVDPDEGRW